MKKYKYTGATKALVFTAILIAITAIFSQIYIPTPWGIPFTLQTLAVCFAGFFLGLKYSIFYIFVYLLGGLIGLPFFSGFNGGVGVFIGGGGGFLIGFIPLVILCALSNFTFKRWLGFLLGALGVIICHTLGVLGYSLVYKTQYFASFLTVSLPYLLKDLCSVVLAKVVADKIKNILEKRKS